jgi:4-amino-4-deoxy-L-arabinose transferase-like glycosyltransferase
VTRIGRLSTSSAILLLTIGVSIALRCVSALLQGDVVAALPGIQDQISYDALAQRVLSGAGFSFGIDWWPATRAGEPTAHWSFLYTLYLTGVYALVGVHPLVARLIQAVIAGALYPLVVWRIGRRMFGPNVGLVAAVIIAVYGYFVYYGGALMTETFYILAVLWALDLALGMAQAAGAIRWRSWVLLGVALSLAVLFRQLVLLFVPFLFLWIAWVRAARPWQGFSTAMTRLRPVILGAALSILVLGATIAPWTVRNYFAFHRLVLLNTNAGYAFFWANHPWQGNNFVSIFPAEVYYEMIPKELLGLDEAALESALMQRAVGFVVSDPGRYALLSLSRTKDYFEFWPSPDSSTISNIARVSSFGIFFPLAVYGIALSLLRRRSVLLPGHTVSLVLLYLFAIVYSLIHLLSWALVRYRLPLDAALMPVAALAIYDLAKRIKESVLSGRQAAIAPGVTRGLAALGRKPQQSLGTSERP